MVVLGSRGWIVFASFLLGMAGAALCVALAIAVFVLVSVKPAMVNALPLIGWLAQHRPFSYALLMFLAALCLIVGFLMSRVAALARREEDSGVSDGA